MAKRFQPISEYSRGKKPKLDITISRERPKAAATPAPANNNNRLPSTTRSTGTRAVASDVCDFWDDDDDDVILLATQVAESQVLAAAATAVTESEITFTEFAPNLRGSTSTQHLNPFPRHQPPTTNRNKETIKSIQNDPLAALFDDNDDCFEALVLPTTNNKPEAAVANPFKKPSTSTVVTAVHSSNVEQREDVAAAVAAPLVPSHSMPITSGQSQSMARRQLASERQIKFLMDRVDKLKKDNGNMQKELGNYKDQMENKTGETSLLRDEVRYLKQQIHTLKMDKIVIAETAKTECRSKLDEINKVVNAKQTELKLKDVEFSILKMKHADDTRRFEMSMLNESAMIITEDCNIGNEINQATSSNRQVQNPRANRKLLRLNEFNAIEQKTEHVNVPFDPLIYDDIRTVAGRKHRTLLQIELDELQKIYIQFQHKAVSPEPTYYAKLKSRLLASICKVFPEFWSYVHSLEFPEETIEYKYKHHDLDEYKCPDDDTRKLIQPTALYKTELGITLRRYVAILALICRQEVDITRTIVEYKHGEYLLLQIASEAIAKLGYSKKIHEHFGLLEAFATLLHALLVKYDKELTLELQELFLDHIKQLVFTRPNAWVFQEISTCFLAATQHRGLLDLCCVNSPSDCFNSDRVRSSFLFSDDSCLMQVYAGLLEIPFGLEKPLSMENFSLLANICDNHVRFVYKCLKEPPKFIRDMLSCCDEALSDDPDDTQTTNNSNNMPASMVNCNSFATTSGSSNSTNMSTTNHCGSPEKTVSSLSNGTDTHGTSKEQFEPNCECYAKMCLSLVTLLFQLLRQWLLKGKEIGKLRVAEISRIGIHVLNIIFREYYIILLFRDSEETTKHYISLIYTWWSEHAADLKFTDIEMRLLGFLKEAHFMLEPLHQVGNLDNIANDLNEWKRLTKSTTDNNDDDITNDLHQLTIQDCLNPLSAENTMKFFDIVKGYAFNFE